MKPKNPCKLGRYLAELKWLAQNTSLLGHLLSMHKTLDLVPSTV